MGLFRCSRCEAFKDSDDGCAEDPRDRLGLLCEECATELEEEAEEAASLKASSESAVRHD